MFELTSDFGDIYEGHIIRIKNEENNQEKLVLLLASARHSDVKLTPLKDLENIIADPANLDATSDPVYVYFESHHTFRKSRMYRGITLSPNEMKFESRHRYTGNRISC